MTNEERRNHISECVSILLEGLRVKFYTLDQLPEAGIAEELPAEYSNEAESLYAVIEGTEEAERRLLELYGETKPQETVWIPCREILPKVEVKVIVARPNRYSGKVDVLTAYLLHSGEERVACGRAGSFQYLTGHYWVLPAIVPFDNITHWMALPPPPPQ